MADFTLSADVRVDASQAVTAVQSATAGVEKLTAATGQGSAAASAAAAADRLRATATGESTSAAAKAAQEELNLSKIRQAVQAQARAQMETLTATARRQQTGIQQLGMQFGDFTQQVSLGINPMIAFGQQAGQAAYAASMMGGAVGKVGTFMAGPWGAAILAATTVVGTQLVNALMGAGKEADNLKDKQADLADYFDRTTGAVKAQITQLQLLSLARAKAATITTAGEALADKRRDLSTSLLDFTLKNQGSKFRSAIPAISAARDAFDAGGSPSSLVATLRTLEQSTPALRSATTQFIAQAAAIDETKATIEKYRAEMAVANGTATEQQRILAGVTTAQKRVSDAVERAAATHRDAAGAAARHAIELKRIEREMAGASDAEIQAAVDAADQKRDAEIKAYNDARAAGRAARREESKEAKDRLKDAEKLRDYQLRAAIEVAELREQLDQSVAASSAKALAELAGVNADEIASAMADGSNRGWQAFEDRGAVAITAIGQALGGALGDAASVFGAIMQGATSGNYTALGGRRGGLLSIAGGALGGAGGDLWAPARYNVRNSEGGVEQKVGLPRGVLAREGIGINSRGDLVPGGAKLGDIFSVSFQDKFKEPFTELKRAITDKFPDLKGGAFAKAAGQAFAGAAQGSISSGVAGALGLKQNGMGAQLGGAIGALIPGLGPFGGMIGGLLGGTLGGLLGGTKKGSTAVSASGGAISVGDAVGNSAGMRKASEAMGNSIGDAIEALVSQLGGDLGDFSVSIGQRKSKFVVDPTGANRTKGSGVQKFKDESEAVQAALADAIRDGAVAGVSPRVQGVLNQYADNLNKAVAEAMKVKGLEDLLANDANPFATLFRDFELQARQRVDAATKYGFDVLEIERINGEERARLVEETLQRSTASVKALLDDLRFGSRAAGSAVERRESLVSERDRLLGLARGGDQGATDKLAQVAQQLLDADREVYGTSAAGAASRAETIGVLEELVAITEKRIADAAKAPEDAAAEKLDTTNGLLDEQTDVLGVISADIKKLLSQPSGGGSPFNPGVAYVTGGGQRDVGAIVRIK